MMLEGDDTTAFALFAGLSKVLETFGVIASDVSRAAVEEYTSYVVEKRKSHLSSGQAASAITDVVRYLLLDFGFQARHRVLRVFKLCCLFVGMPAVKYPVVTFDLSGSALEPRSFQNCLRLVQSYVMCAVSSPQGPFSDQINSAVQRAVSDAGIFFVTAGFDLWSGFCRADSDAFLTQHATLYNTFDAEYSACNAANRLSRVCAGSKTSSRRSLSECGSDAGSSTSSAGTVFQKKNASGSKKSVSGSKLDAPILSKKNKKPVKKPSNN